MSLQKLMNLMHQWNEWNSAFLPYASCSSIVLRDQIPAHKVLNSEYFILCIFTTYSSENSKSKFYTVVFWAVPQCSLEEGYKQFTDSMLLQNTGINLQDYMVLQPRDPQSEQSPL
jgi:hypothetical protein